MFLKIHEVTQWGLTKNKTCCFQEDFVFQMCRNCS